MTEDTAAARPAPAISRIAALLSFAGAATFVVLLAALHFIERELDPSRHFISEYASGDYGWMMVVAFLSLALSYVSLFVAIRSQLLTIIGRDGLALLMVSALGLTIAAEGGRFDWRGALRLGALVWVFPAMILLGSVAHENVSLMLSAIHAGDWLVKLLLVAVIIGVWRKDGALKVSR